MRSRLRHQLLVAVVLIGTVVAHNAMTGSTPAHAQVQDPQDLNQVADFIWDVKTKSGLSRHTNSSLNIVWDLHELGDVMYVAGDFTTLVAPDGTERPQRFLAAFDTLTGEPVPGFDPSLDNVVYSIETNNAGQIVVGGEFDGGVAILDAATGARITPFDADVSNAWGTPAVYSLKVNGDWVYAGGNFTKAQSSTVDRLVRLDRSTGDLDTAWRPTLEPALYNGETREFINDLEIDAARNRLYVAGWFGSINGESETDALAVLDLETGEKAMDHPNIVYDNRDVTFLYDVALDGDTVHYGGKENFTVTTDADTFERDGKVAYTNNGDHQVMHVGQDTLWIGCHCWRQAFVAEPPHNPFAPTDDAIDVNALFGIDKATGEVVQKTFDLRGTAGVWDIEEDQHGRLWAAGQFTQTGGRAVHGLVRFSSKPVPPANCSAALVNGTIQISWTRAPSDNATNFVIRRQRNNGSYYWMTRVGADLTSRIDTNVAVGSTYSYTVETTSGTAASAPRGCIPNGILVTNNANTPLAPTNCTVSSTGNGIRVDWNRAANDNATNFVVRRSRNGGSHYWAGRTGAGSTWTDANIAVGDNYAYTVETRSGATASTATTCSPSPILVDPSANSPVPPTSCTVSMVNGNPRITWIDAPGDSGTSIVIRRSRDGGLYFWATRVMDPAVTWTDTTANSRFDYSYTVESRLGRISSSSTPCT